MHRSANGTVATKTTENTKRMSSTKFVTGPVSTHLQSTANLVRSLVGVIQETRFKAMDIRQQLGLHPGARLIEDHHAQTNLKICTKKNKKSSRRWQTWT